MNYVLCNIWIPLIMAATVLPVSASNSKVLPTEAKAIALYEQTVKINDNLILKEKDKLVGLVDPYERNETQIHPLKTLTKYFSLPFGIEILAIVFTPVIAAVALRYIMNRFFKLECPQKAHQDDRRRGIFFEQSPHLPLYFLQQTKLEAKVKRQSRQTLAWYSKKWTLKTNKLIEEVGGFSQYSNKRDPDQNMYLLKQNRWKIIQTAVRLGGLYRKFMKKRNQHVDLSSKNRKIRMSVLIKMKHENVMSNKSNMDKVIRNEE